MKVFIALSVLVAAVCANSQYPAPAYPAEEYPAPKYSAPKYPAPAAKYEEPPQPPKPYNFGYAVKDQEHYTDFQQQEASDGQVVSGSYRVNLPDGRVQTVTYKAGPNGNVVDVAYEGEAKYPEYVPAKKEYPTPAYPKKEYPAPAYPEYAPAKKEYPAPAYPRTEYPAPAYPAKEY